MIIVTLGLQRMDFGHLAEAEVEEDLALVVPLHHPSMSLFHITSNIRC
jgi:hypothetical protein